MGRAPRKILWLGGAAGAARRDSRPTVAEAALTTEQLARALVREARFGAQESNGQKRLLLHEQLRERAAVTGSHDEALLRERRDELSQD